MSLPRAALFAVSAFCAVALSACGNDGPSNTPGASGPDSQTRPAVVGAADELGTTVILTSVEKKDDNLEVGLRILNGGRSTLEVTGPRRQIEARFSDGTTLTSSDEPTSVPSRTVDEMTVELGGQVPTEAGTFQLDIPLRGGATGGGNVTLTDVPFDPESVTRFALPEPAAIADETLAAHHPSGVHVYLRRVTTTSDGVEISFLAVNGSGSPIDLSGNRDPILLTDSTGRRLAEVPADNNPQLTIPAKGRMTGTLRFAGAPAAGAERMSLVFNDRFGSESATFAFAPALSIDNIPVPGGSE